MTLRLMTWNVRSLRDDRSAVIDVIRRCAPDVLFVQEAPRFLRAQSKLAALARGAGLVVGAGGRPAAGVAVLTTLRVDVDASESHLLGKTAGLHQRGVAVVEASFGGHRFVVASLHLGLKADERQRHADEISAIVDRRGLPAAVAGDFNEGAGGAAWRRLLDGRRDAGEALALPTYPADEPEKRIDTVMVPAAWETTAVSLAETVSDSDLIRATDHRPVVVDVVAPL